MTDDNPAFYAFKCDECPCRNALDDYGEDGCNLGYEQFRTDKWGSAAELDKCLLTSVRWKGGLFEPVAVLVNRHVYKSHAASVEELHRGIREYAERLREELNRPSRLLESLKKANRGG